MSKRLRDNWNNLKVLKSANPSLRKAILKSADADLVRCLCDCAHNILKGTVKLSPAQKKALCRHSCHLRQLTGKKSLKAKRNILVQKGGFIPALLGPIIGLAASVLPHLIK